MKKVKRLLFCAVLLVAANAWAVSRQYTVTENEDGGYTLNIVVEERHLGLTCEGFCPKTRHEYEIRLVGPGTDEWKARNQGGFHYPANKVVWSWNRVAGDWGYAWVDRKREKIYINWYWIHAPDSLTPAKVNACYTIKGHEAKKEADE